MKELLDKAKQQFDTNFPFVLYNKPNSESVIGIFQKKRTIFKMMTLKAGRKFIFLKISGCFARSCLKISCFCICFQGI